jgi:hypothetical protein
MEDGTLGALDAQLGLLLQLLKQQVQSVAKTGSGKQNAAVVGLTTDGLEQILDTQQKQFTTCTQQIGAMLCKAQQQFDQRAQGMAARQQQLRRELARLRDNGSSPSCLASMAPAEVSPRLSVPTSDERRADADVRAVAPFRDAKKITPADLASDVEELDRLEAKLSVRMSALVNPQETIQLDSTGQEDVAQMGFLSSIEEELLRVSEVAGAAGMVC